MIHTEKPKIHWALVENGNGCTQREKWNTADLRNSLVYVSFMYLWKTTFIFMKLLNLSTFILVWIHLNYLTRWQMRLHPVHYSYSQMSLWMSNPDRKLLMFHCVGLTLIQGIPIYHMQHQSEPILWLNKESCPFHGRCKTESHLGDKSDLSCIYMYISNVLIEWLCNIYYR
jgi:hypothetical protein